MNVRTRRADLAEGHLLFDLTLRQIFTVALLPCHGRMEECSTAFLCRPAQ